MSKNVTAAQKAYGLLWRSLTNCGYAQAARWELLSSMTKEEQRDAVKWVVETTPKITDAEMMAADMRVGVFPHRTYDPTDTGGDVG